MAFLIFFLLLLIYCHCHHHFLKMFFIILLQYLNSCIEFKMIDFMVSVIHTSIFLCFNIAHFYRIPNCYTSVSWNAK